MERVGLPDESGKTAIESVVSAVDANKIPKWQERRARRGFPHDVFPQSGMSVRTLSSGSSHGSGPLGLRTFFPEGPHTSEVI